MLAIRAHRFGAPDVLRLEDVPRPTPAAGELLVRVDAASVNFSDIMRRRNDPYPFPTTLPFTPGSEVAGTVAALGPGVAGPPVGTPVFALVGTGATTATGGYAEYAVADATRAIPLPPGLAPDVACSLLVAGFTALVALREVARLSPGGTVLVEGAAGGVGTYAVQLARALGAGLVIGTASTAARRAHARAMGAHHVLDSRAAAWGDAVRTLTDGRGADVVLECGGAATFPEALHALAPFGALVVLGFASGQPLALDAAQVERVFYAPAPNQSLHALNIGGWFLERPARSAELLGELVGHVLAGRVQAAPERVPLAAAAQAHARLAGGEAVGKLVLVP